MTEVNQAHNQYLDMDEETAALILQLQLDDLEEFKERSRGKQKEGDVSDTQIAAQFFEEDLKSARTSLQDQRMTRSIARAVQADGNAVAQSHHEEEVARRYHVMARRLSGSNLRADAQNAGVVQGPELQPELMAKLAGLYVDEAFGQELDTASRSGTVVADNDIDANTQGESSSWAATRSKQNGTNNNSGTRRCEACRDEKKFFDLIPAQCGHEYCRDCIIGLFTSSFTDESLFPPRCCRVPIPIETAGIFLTKKLKQEFAEKQIEFSTSDRTYCSRSDCSTFIKPEHIHNQVGHCVKCEVQTCTVCKNVAHSGQDCPQDPNIQEVRELARQEGWQTCYSCRRLVELDTGCHHMTCLCRAEFCYLCGRQWKTCECPQWDEERLLHRAQAIAHRQLQPQLRIPEVNLFQIAEGIANRLREDHNCDHEQWRYVGGRHECEECHHTLPQYIFECRQCHLRACNRCRRNRL